MDHQIRFIAGCVLLIASVWALTRPSSEPIPYEHARVTLPDGFVVTAELALSATQQEKGLSDRTQLGNDQGMLFVYPIPDRPAFWMKDMLFPIDLLWIFEGRVIGYELFMQPEHPPKTLYVPPRSVQFVLEVPAGFVQKHQIQRGDVLDIQR